MRKKTHIYLIAGEASGDFIGSRLIRSLTKKINDSLVISGIGGERMQQEGLSSLFPMQELSLMGFAEIVPHIFSLKRRIRQTVDDIIATKPDALVTIDSPGFTFRVVKQLRERDINIPIVHYVAPTVWAYKEKRAAKTAALFDKLLTLLPFEPPYFEKEGLKTTFVGHPVAWDWKEKGDGKAFRERHNLPTEGTILGMMPGSRLNEVKRHLPVYKETIEKLIKNHPALTIIMPLRHAMADEVRTQVQDWPAPVFVVVGDREKKDAFAACDIALAKSGTVALETSLANIPTVTTYRANPLSVWFVRRLIRVSHVNLINIIENKTIIPEYLQEECAADILAPALHKLLSDKNTRDQQLSQCQAAINQLGQQDETSPSDKATDAILACL